MQSTLVRAARACAKRFVRRAGCLAPRPVRALAVVAAAQGVATAAHAGAGGTEFQTVYDQVSGWTNGVLGKTMAVSALLVGLGIGIIKQSVMSGVVAVAMALVAGFGPGAIDGVITVGHPITVPI